MKEGCQGGWSNDSLWSMSGLCHQIMAQASSIIIVIMSSKDKTLQRCCFIVEESISHTYCDIWVATWAGYKEVIFWMVIDT